MLQPENIESKLTEISVIINLGKFTASTKRAVTINAKQLSGLQETRWSMCCRQWNISKLWNYQVSNNTYTSNMLQYLLLNLKKYMKLLC